MRPTAAKRVLTSLVVLITFSAPDYRAHAQTNWAVWKHNSASPGQVVVAHSGSLKLPWKPDSVWGDDLPGALKKACCSLIAGYPALLSFKSHPIGVRGRACLLIWPKGRTSFKP